MDVIPFTHCATAPRFAPSDAGGISHSLRISGQTWPSDQRLSRRAS